MKKKKQIYFLIYNYGHSRVCVWGKCMGVYFLVEDRREVWVAKSWRSAPLLPCGGWN